MNIKSDNQNQNNMKHYINYFGIITMVSLFLSIYRGYIIAFAASFGLFIALVALFRLIC